MRERERERGCASSYPARSAHPPLFFPVFPPPPPPPPPQDQQSSRYEIYVRTSHRAGRECDAGKVAQSSTRILRTFWVLIARKNNGGIGMLKERDQSDKTKG